MAEYIHYDAKKVEHNVLDVAGKLLVSRAKRNMNKTSLGVAYSYKGRVHIASLRGDTANNLTGDLFRTIRYEVRGNVLEFGAGNITVDYAKYLENAEILDRPNYHKTIIETEPEISKVVELEILSELS